LQHVLWEVTMPVVLFRVPIAVESVGGQAAPAVPAALDGLNYRFVIARDGAEAIVEVDAPKEALERVAADAACERLTAREAAKLREGYPPPRLKRRFRPAEAGAGGEYALDAQGNPVVETVQTVRAGLHLVDIPLPAEEK
jgi:hypothetical protein